MKIMGLFNKSEKELAWNKVKVCEFPQRQTSLWTNMI